MSDSNTNSTPGNGKDDAAVNLIRQKIDAIHTTEPDAAEEVTEVQHAAHRPSKHQQFMKELSGSGKSLAEIQTSWHNYYVSLPDEEKHQVWQEFYAEHDKQQKQPETKPSNPVVPNQALRLPSSSSPAVHQVSPPSAHQSRRTNTGARTVSEVKKQLLTKANSSVSGKLKAKQHFQSLLFGVGMGAIVVLVLLFGLFNDRFIAPFITPSKTVSDTPIIIDNATAVDSVPKVVIPKINVEIPVVYDEPSVEEHAIQNALERGVVHYATTPSPGEKGNAIIFGHSSNNILNQGKYKFAFVLLKRLEVGDTFYLNKDGVRYAYRVFEKRIVAPTEVDVLTASTGKEASATLITCDPPGTSLNRLVVTGEQISPNPNNNKASTASKDSATTTVIPSNAPSIWQRIKDWFS